MVENSIEAATNGRWIKPSSIHGLITRSHLVWAICCHYTCSSYLSRTGCCP